MGRRTVFVVARSCVMELGTVHDYLERAAAAGIGWPLPEGLREEELENQLFGNQPVAMRALRQCQLQAEETARGIAAYLVTMSRCLETRPSACFLVGSVGHSAT